VLRLLRFVPMMKRITEALLKSIPGMGAILAVILLVIYVGAVMATNMYGNTVNADVHEMFGTLPDSALTLFQLMTMDGWSDMLDTVTEDGHPFAWIFFLIFIFVGSFAILNLFIALIVEALSAEQKAALGEQIENLGVAMEERIQDAPVSAEVTDAIEEIRARDEVIEDQLEHVEVGLEEAEAELGSGSTTAQGVARVNVPLSFGLMHLAPLWPRLRPAAHRLAAQAALAAPPRALAWLMA
jgi:voltage-gated sodium channel